MWELWKELWRDDSGEVRTIGETCFLLIILVSMSLAILMLMFMPADKKDAIYNKFTPTIIERLNN
ncbi:MAG: hypothetical protein A4E56_00408 [Pelotomaculum sp. PtaU1.Bin065]|nr:MAG: hypothetical protein A4E56_00408 [Pelotomaculum sp. PtaU1.Bin065]